MNNKQSGVICNMVTWALSALSMAWAWYEQHVAAVVGVFAILASCFTMLLSYLKHRRRRLMSHLPHDTTTVAILTMALLPLLATAQIQMPDVSADRRVEMRHHKAVFGIERQARIEGRNIERSDNRVPEYAHTYELKLLARQRIALAAKRNSHVQRAHIQ